MTKIDPLILENIHNTLKPLFDFCDNTKNSDEVLEFFKQNTEYLRRINI